jgi:hypothetical protein
MLPPKDTYSKATVFHEIGNAVRFDIPIDADHEFYVNFSDVRGDFEDKLIYKKLNVNSTNFSHNSPPSATRKTILFLAGMRGSGKTSELATYSQKIHNPECYYCITCNLDTGLDANDIEFMDVLIFQIERLLEELEKSEVPIDNGIISELQNWFAERINEVNRLISIEGGYEVSVKASTPSIFNFLNLTGSLVQNLKGTKRNAQLIRTVFKNNFSDFSLRANLFFEHSATLLREKKLARDILFIIDGLEKIATPDIRRKLIIDEANRIASIKVNMIFTLPIELMLESPRLNQFSTVISFPFVKIKEKNGSVNEKAVDRFVEFVLKRIDKKFFESEELMRQAIFMGGGSPRELLRVLEYWYLQASDELLDKKGLDKAIHKLAETTAHYLTKKDLELLKQLQENNKNNIPTPYGEEWHKLLEDLTILEYNDGTYKRVNPVVEESSLYKHYVIGG